MTLSINEQDKQVADALSKWGIKWGTSLIQTGATGDDDGDQWEHDQWMIVINGQTFEFRTGTGHRLAPKNGKSKWDYMKFRPEAGRELKALRKVLDIPSPKPVYFKIEGDFPTYAVMPTQASVLYCLLSDMQCGDYTFREFCENLGYDHDSRRAEKTYFSCQDTADKMRRVFSRDQIESLNTILEDY